MSLPSKPANQSPEQAFDIPLFPGYVRPIPTSQPLAAWQTNNVATATPTEGHTTDMEKLLTQYGKLSSMVQEQARMYHEQAYTLQQQMANQAEAHHKEMRQLEQAWSHRLDTVISATQQLATDQLADGRGSGRHSESVSRKSAARAPFAQPSAAITGHVSHPETYRPHTNLDQATHTHTARGQNTSGQAHSQSHSRPQGQAVKQKPQKRSKLSPLQSVSATYLIPHRTPVSWVDKFLGAAPAFVALVVVGTGIAALSAIALSPTVLWPSLSLVIQAVIPFIFVTGLVSVGITAVWDAARS